jgi:hypothetical protein
MNEKVIKLSVRIACHHDCRSSIIQTTNHPGQSLWFIVTGTASASAQPDAADIAPGDHASPSFQNLGFLAGLKKSSDPLLIRVITGGTHVISDASAD